jgi:3-deoxy-manno-octulosonate cytidylyltransferase (CMP-KDO synthetase)
MKVVAVIPARFGSTRFPGKPLVRIADKPMIQHVYERVKEANLVDKVIVATDHNEIYDVVCSFGGTAFMTKKEHESGSDRMAEVAQIVDGDLFLNVQGDEPLINHEIIDMVVAEAKEYKDSVVTAKTKIINQDDLQNPNVVKVVTDNEKNALYFSRSIIPYNRSNEKVDYYKHLGIYCFPKNILKQFVTLPKSKLEKIEMLEQLRLLENGFNLRLVTTDYNAIGVDTPEDVEKIRKILEA